MESESTLAADQRQLLRLLGTAVAASSLLSACSPAEVGLTGIDSTCDPSLEEQVVSR